MLLQKGGQEIFEYLIKSGWARDLVKGFVAANLQGELPVLSAKGLRVVEGRREVLQGVDLDVVPGEIVAVVGLTGAGKSTLISTLAGVTRPAQGSVTIKASHQHYASVHHDADSRTALLGLSLQEPSLYPELTIEENLFHFGSLYGLDRRNAKVHVDNAIELVGLGALRAMRVSQLALGQRRRADIAAAIIHGPQVVLLDGPFDQLDPMERVQVHQVLRTLAAKGVTIVLTASAPEDLGDLSARILRLETGRLNADSALPAAKGYTVRLQTAEGDYGGILDHLRYLGLDDTMVERGTLRCQTEHPEVVMREMTKKVIEERQTLRGMWCDQGGIYGAR